jgi:hypothetical protein
MLRTVSYVALVLSLLGCYSAGASAPPGKSLASPDGPSAPAGESVTSSAGPTPSPGESVPLLTGDLGCYAGGEGGPTAPLIAEPQYGTSFAGKPVMWPTGYSARRFGAEVQVLDRHGKVKATTGRTYHISQAFAPALIPNDDGPFEAPGPHDAWPAAADCTYHHDFIDCTANPTDAWCQPPEPPTVTPTPPQSAP